MAGAMRKMAVYLGLVEDEADLHDEYDDYVEPRPSSSRSRSESYGGSVTVAETPSVRTFRDEPATTTRRTPTVAAPAPERRPAPAPAPASAPVSFGDHYTIHTIHPRNYNDARRIGEEFRDGVPVIMNLSEMDDSDAKRIIDFAAGLIFGLHGSIERVTNKVFLLSPANVDVAAEARAQVAQDGFFNQS